MYSFYIIFLSIFLINSTIESDINVGTILFTKSDLYKQCWNNDNIALLTSRMIFEDLLPNPTIVHINSNEFIQNLIEYFKLILNILRKETYGRTKHITLIALTDILGGYLQHTVLPIARYSFYSGLINYETIDLLMRFFNEIKLFLHTNGDGWSMNLQQNCNNINDNTEIEAIRFNDADDDSDNNDYCNDLIIFNSDKNLTIPLPFFDSIEQPTSIALPLKSQPLHNLFIKKSSNLLMEFFIKSIKCLQHKHVNLYKFEQIKNEWLQWLEQEIIPKLDDPVLYTAFGGILRVQYTLKHIGTMGLKQHQQKSIKHQLLHHKNIIFIVILILLFICFLLGLLFICYKLRVIRKNRILKNQCHPKCPGSDNKSIMTTTTTTTTKSSKYFFPESTKCSCCKSDISINNDYHHQNTDKKRNKEHAIIETTHTEKKLPTFAKTSEITKKSPKKKQRFPFFESTRARKNTPKKSCCESCKCGSIDFATSDSSILTDDNNNNNNNNDVGVDKNVVDVKTTSGESDYDEDRNVDNNIRK